MDWTGTARSAVVVSADQLDRTPPGWSGRSAADRPRTVLVATSIDSRPSSPPPRSGSAACCGAPTRPPTLSSVPSRQVARRRGRGAPDLLGRLLEQVGRLQRQVLAPRGLAFSGLSPRETEVLRPGRRGRHHRRSPRRCAATDGQNVLHDLTTRLQLKNRTHAVAYAMREDSSDPVPDSGGGLPDRAGAAARRTVRHPLGPGPGRARLRG